MSEDRYDPDRLSDDDLDALLGAYALDAVEAHERNAVESYLSRSPKAAREVAEHLEAAAMLGNVGGEAPPEIWDTIAARLHDIRPAKVVTVADVAADGLPGVVSMLDAVRALDEQREDRTPRDSGPRRPATRRQSWPRRMIATVSIAAAAVGLVGFGIGTIVSRDPDRDPDRGGTSVEALAQRARSRSGTREALLMSSDRLLEARAVLTEDGEGFLFGDGLPALPEGRVYQLWGVKGDTVLSLGVLGRRPSAVSFAADDDWNALAITAEDGPGVTSSTNTPVVVGPI